MTVLLQWILVLESCLDPLNKGLWFQILGLGILENADSSPLAWDAASSYTSGKLLDLILSFTLGIRLGSP